MTNITAIHTISIHLLQLKIFVKLFLIITASSVPVNSIDCKRQTNAGNATFAGCMICNKASKTLRDRSSGEPKLYTHLLDVIVFVTQYIVDVAGTASSTSKNAKIFSDVYDTQFWGPKGAAIHSVYYI